MGKFEKYLNEKENEKIKLALTDTTAVTLKKSGINKKNKEFEAVNSQESNKQLSTLGDSIIKFYLCSYFYGKAENISEKKKYYETDEFLVSVIAKQYNILDKLDYDSTKKPNDYNYIKCGKTSTGKNKKSHNDHKFIATAVEAMIGAIYLINKDGNWFEEISTILKEWMTFE